MQSKFFILLLGLFLPNSFLILQPLSAKPIGYVTANHFIGSSEPTLIAQVPSSSEMAKAVKLFKSGSYADSVSIFSRIISAPNSGRSTKNKALVARAQAFIVLGQPALALLDLNKVTYDNDELNLTAELHLIRGTTYIQLKDYKSAVTELSKSIAIFSDEASAYANRAVAYQALGDLSSARSDLNISLDIDPIPSTVYNLAVLEKTTGNYKRCYFLLSRLSESDYAYADVFIQQALCAESMGNVDEALNNFLRAASLDNTNPLVLKKIGTIVANAGDKKTGIRYLERASEIYLTNGSIPEYTNILEVLENLRK